jgi:hypothetical protein
MERQRLIVLAAGGASVLVAGGLALAWVARPPRPAPVETPLAASRAAVAALAQVARPPRPAPVETRLAASRAAVAALAEARQGPLTARLQGALRNDPAAGDLLARILASPVPVIGPPDPGLLRKARFFPDERQYTLVVRPPGQVVEIFGTARAFRPPEGVTLPPLPRPTAPPSAPPASTRRLPPNPLASALAQGRARGLADIRTERTEYGADVSFSLFGAAYNISLICDDRAATACSETAAVQFATRLELIGGGR